QAATTPAGATREFHLAERDGRLCGYAMLESRWWTDDPASFSLDLTVDPPARGQGIGMRLYSHALERAATLHATQLYAAVRDDLPEAARFAAVCGFVPTGHTLRWARLRVSQAPLAALDAVADSLEAAGISIVALAELDADEPLLRRVYEVDCESAQDEPAAQSYEPQPFEQWRTWIFDEPGVTPEWFWLALDGTRPVGMTYLVDRGEGIAATGYTGVLRAYRGRGVATALKRAALQGGRARGTEYIYTGNDLTNAPMLAINGKLGFEPLPASVQLVKQLGSTTL
ncbi:MAG TPA: GNAT family N-acetyltransferase, partial [Chloroflexia bacterium]|nr:GNAT family N-acetyltransferase [Chloroflexia bacterium]